MKLTKNIPWQKLGFTPKPQWNGILSISIFTIIVFLLVQLFSQYINLPDWVTDKDLIVPLLAGVIAQEFIFRALLITWLERYGKHKALWISTLIFALSHLVFPSSWFITVLSIIGGYFWGWHFLKYRNFYLLVLSHLIVNLAFNYLFF